MYMYYVCVLYIIMIYITFNLQQGCLVHKQQGDALSPTPTYFFTWKTLNTMKPQDNSAAELKV